MLKVFVIFLSALLAVEEASMVGGAKDIDIHNEGVQNALNFAVAKHNRESNDMFLNQVDELVKAQVQVVAGLKYILTVKMVQTSCRKGSSNQLCDSQSQPANPRSYQCTFTVWSRPWMNDIRVTEEKC